MAASEGKAEVKNARNHEFEGPESAKSGRSIDQYDGSNHHAVTVLDVEWYANEIHALPI